MKEEKKINLVVFTREYPVGMASTKRIQHLMEYLISRGVVVNILAFRGNIPQPETKGVYNTIPYQNIGHGIKLSLRQTGKVISYYLSGFKSIAQSKRKGWKNIIYKAGGLNIENILFVIWAKLLGFKMVMAIEEDYSFFSDNIKLISRFKIWTIRKLDFLNCKWADEIIVISYYLKNKYLKKGVDRITLIPVTARINSGEKNKSFNKPLQVVYAGTFADKDGVSDIIKGFLEFKKSFKEAILILTGKSAQQEEYKEKYSNEKDLLFKGFVEDNDFYPLLRDSDVLCMCRTESGFANAGFPFKLGEYLATGNPVICTKVSDVEYYLGEDDAYLIEPGNPQQITGALLSIVNDPDAARERGMKGLEKCRKFFSAETNGRILLDVLERM
jgi:glycosyltransferase involved in cell wall biosynthesis